MPGLLAGVLFLVAAVLFGVQAIRDNSLISFGLCATALGLASPLLTQLL